MSDQRKRQIRDELECVRARTLWLLESVPDEFLRRRVHSFYSPIGWHFGHVGRTEESWVVCAALGQPTTDEALDFLYTDRPDNPKDNRVAIPDRQGTISYLAKTRARVLDALDDADLDDPNPLIHDGYAWSFAIQHECQHQETICEMLQLIQKQLPADEVEVLPWKSSHLTEFRHIQGGVFVQGSDDPDGYDNEKRAHEVAVQEFRLAQHPVTCYDWTRFMGDRGYARSELWSPEGWQWKEGENASMPEYWIQQQDGWASYGPTGVRALHPDEPVLGISWHEAQSYSRWANKRLPTEAEWEFAAAYNEEGDKASLYPWGDEAPDDRRACFGMTHWGPCPVGERQAGRSRSGIEELAGNVWEWTSTPFLPYPGFEAYPYEGYSKDHMKGEHRVCRGGSWATSAKILRCTFRNWYVPTYRQGFLGLRLADD